MIFENYYYGIAVPNQIQIIINSRIKEIAYSIIETESLLLMK